MPPSAPTGQRAAASFSLGEEGNTTVDIVIQPAYQQLEAVKALLLEYTSMLLEQNPAAAGSCLQRQNFEGELANLAEKYGAPQGRLYLIRVDGAPAGCAAMKRLDRYRCELKRLYIRPPFRGQGLARRLVERLLTPGRRGTRPCCWTPSPSSPKPSGYTAPWASTRFPDTTASGGALSTCKKI